MFFLREIGFKNRYGLQELPPNQPDLTGPLWAKCITGLITKLARLCHWVPVGSSNWVFELWCERCWGPKCRHRLAAASLAVR